METFFWCLAIGGTALFILKTVLLLVGADGGAHDAGGLDAGGMDAGVGDAGGHGDHHASDAAFTLLSIQSLSTLAMGMGWMGLSAMRSFGFPEVQALLLGFGFGLLLVVLMGKLLQKVRKLESSGTLEIKGAVGSTGTVYVTVPEKGRGQVQIVLQGRLVTLDATTHGTAIPTGRRIRVDAVEDGGLLVVASQ